MRHAYGGTTHRLRLITVRIVEADGVVTQWAFGFADNDAKY